VQYLVEKGANVSYQKRVSYRNWTHKSSTISFLL